MTELRTASPTAKDAQMLLWDLKARRRSNTHHQLTSKLFPQHTTAVTPTTSSGLLLQVLSTSACLIPFFFDRMPRRRTLLAILDIGFITDAILNLSVSFSTGLRSCRTRSLVKSQFKPESGSFVSYTQLDKIHEAEVITLKSQWQLKIKVINQSQSAF